LADAVNLGALMAAAYAPYVARLGSTLPVGGDYADEIARYPVWIAEQDGRMVGALVLQPQRDHMQLANVAVLPDQQGRGIGRALLQKAEAEARAGGYQDMRLFTHAGMPDNIALYERHGWIRLCSEPGSLRVAMIKWLEPGQQARSRIGCSDGRA
jgi:ribosomal protein S18 acetylase RimI-like enzyme